MLAPHVESGGTRIIIELRGGRVVQLNHRHIQEAKWDAHRVATQNRLGIEELPDRIG